MARKSSRKSANAEFNMTAEVAIGTPSETTDAILSGLLEQLDEVESDTLTITDDASEIIESAAEDADELIEQVSAEAADTVASMNAESEGESLDAVDALLDEVAGDAARIEAKQELYAEQGADAAATVGDAPATDPAELTNGKQGKKKATATKEPKVPKEPRATSVTHKPGDLLKVKLGAAAAEVLVFDLNDATLDPESLSAKQQAFIDEMNDPEAIADKVKDKIQMFLVWMSKGGELNEVLKRAITVLHEKGELTSGDKGNLQLNLLTKPYSLGTARSQANQMFMALPILGLTVKEKGRMIPNANSALLPMAKTKLGLV